MKVFWKTLAKVMSVAVGIAVCIVLGVVAAAVINETTFSIEWTNMIAWISSWAK